MYFYYLHTCTFSFYQNELWGDPSTIIFPIFSILRFQAKKIEKKQHALFKWKLYCVTSWYVPLNPKMWFVSFVKSDISSVYLIISLLNCCFLFLWHSLELVDFFPFSFSVVLSCKSGFCYNDSTYLCFIWIF